MKILLIRPISRKATNVMPLLGLGYLATALLKDGHEVEYLDCVRDKLTMRKWWERCRAGDVGDVIGIQYFTCDHQSVVRMSRIAKKYNPNVKIAVGGPHVSGNPKCILKENLDFGFVGEAIKGFPMLLKNNFKRLTRVPGLVYKEKGMVRQNPNSFLENPDDFGIPAWDLIRPDKYPLMPHGSFSRGKKTCPIMATFGCPFNCQYCAGKKSTGAKLRKRSAENIMKEIKLLHSKFGIDEIHFEDDNFTLDKEFAKQVCLEIIKWKEEEKIEKFWFACPNGVRLETLDEELLRIMEEAGFYSFAVGIESGNDRILSKMGRRVTKEVIREKIELIAKTTKIRITGFCIMGYPTETLEEMEETAKFTRELPIHRVFYGNFHPLPGTPVYDWLISCGEIMERELNWNNFQDNTISYSPKGVSFQELKKMMEISFKKFYLRPKIILGLAGEIKNPRQAGILVKRAMESFF
jgi:radical SAM superfamily enzyme YgiQ (UPF0313 family)